MNLFEQITGKIIALIESGQSTKSISWSKQGASLEMPVNFKTGHHYSGVNVLLLWIAARENNFSSNAWLTFKQVSELGGRVRKGERSTTGIFFCVRDEEIPKASEDDPAEMRKVSFARAFHLFNLDQVVGLDKPPVPSINTWNALQSAESLIARTDARIIEGGKMACYDTIADTIRMPDRVRFSCAENFYAVLLHELVHWTSAPTRCNRELGKRFGDGAYAMEELVAELGSAFLSAELGIDGQTEGHASYIQSWLEVLRKDSRAILTAASKASQAAKFVLEGQALQRQSA